MTEILDEMSNAWVTALADAIEQHGHEILDAHESAIVISLGPDARAALDAEPGDVLVIGWTERAGLDWGISADGAHVPNPQPLGGVGAAEWAARVHRVLVTGRPEARPLRHAIPYAAASTACVCPVVHPCGGIVPDSDCPDHGARRTPAMAWHWEADCDPIPR